MALTPAQSITVVIDTTQDVSKMLKVGQPRQNLIKLANLVNGLKAGNLQGKVQLAGSSAVAVAASGTFTLVSVVATDACTIGKTTFTFTSTPSVSSATAQDVEVDGASDTLDAAALAAAINVNEATKEIVYATSALGVVTVTARTPGVIGNYINISDADTTITTSATFLAGGTGGAGSVANPLTIGR